MEEEKKNQGNLARGSILKRGECALFHIPDKNSFYANEHNFCKGLVQAIGHTELVNK